ncbi:hypothetical protein BDQ12DRAFT_738756 [Crucibulum laeve]|uniref:Uncharacterized protein n=1 Tax=Crucibulum laeve TaxID=68775 RepID=A0A5C3LL58_9AGAR|nr:hypothetical protein BDQ12DRAFT_738756 [Crucibulum laeve]
MHVLLVYAASVVAAANAAQVAFNVSPPDALNSNSNDEWSFTTRPALNSTSHLVFDTVASALQHWPHTRYRNGHTLYPATLPPGTLLYHGTYHPEVPKIPEWTATDPEHSYMFCRERWPIGSPSSSSSSDHHNPQSQESSNSSSSENRDQDEGCYHLTLVSTRPLRLLYFDGSSAAKMQGGPMDAQDLIAWGEVKPEWAFKERERLAALCEWAKAGNEERRVDGFVRMEMDL